MKTTFTFAILALLAAAEVRAEEIAVQVDGMVCSFCAQGIIKKFEEQSSVEKTTVNLDEKMVHIRTKKDATLTDKDIRQTVDWAGYSTVGITRKGESQ